MSPSAAVPTPAQSAMDWQTVLGNTRLAVVAMETASHDTMQFVMCSSVLPIYAALAPTKEAPSLVPSSCSHPADILLPHWSHGRPAALDVSVISPLQHLTLAGAASLPGHALRVCVQRKMSSNLPACRSAGVDFLPIVVETLGVHVVVS